MVFVFEQVLILFIFAAVGYALSEFKIVKHEHSTILSRLLVYVFLPANSIKAFSKNCTVDYISNNYKIVIASSVVVIVLAVSMHFAAKLFSRDGYERSVYEYSLVMPNYGYMGYAVAEAVFGEIGLINAYVFAIPMSVYVYSIGYCILSKKKLSLRGFLNPAIISMLIGMALGLSGLGAKTPELIGSILDKASNCMAPVSMLLAGIVVSEFNAKKILSSYRIYIVAALRLLVIPVAIGAALYAVGFSEIAPVAILLYAMPCGLNTVVFPKNVGENCEIGAGLALVSNIAVCITVPLVFMIFGI